MSRKKINSLVEKSDSKSLPALADQVIFSPTAEQMKVKARFWARWTPSPFSADKGLISLQKVLELTEFAGVSQWWSKPGFKYWFANRSEAAEKLEFLFMQALETAEQILIDPEAQTNAKVQMIKVVAELANKFPSRQAEKFSDEEINRMSEEQLKAWLERRGVQTIEPEEVKQVEQDSKTSSDD